LGGDTPTFSCVSLGEYWIEQSTHRGFLRQKLDADVIQADFRGGVRLELDQENRIDTLLVSGFTKRFLEYRKDMLSLTAGNFYATFGRGLTLRAFEEADIYFDRDIDGLRLAGSWPNLEATALIGKPLESATRTRERQITGAEVKGTPLPGLNLAASYVRSDAANTSQDPSLGLPVEELSGTSASISWRNLSAYGEFASRNTWGQCDPDFGWVEDRNVKGRGWYFSGTAGLAGLAFFGEYKDYRNLDSPLNSPPTCNRTGRPLNYGWDEKGYHLEGNASPWEHVSFLADVSEAYTDDRSQRYAEASGEMEIERLESWSLRASLLRTREVGLQAAIPEKTEIGPALEFTKPLGQRHSVTLAGEYHQARLDYRLGTSFEYSRRSGALTYSYAPWVVLYFSWEQATEKIPEYANEDRWVISELTLKLSENHEVKIRQGDERGGLVCSGGVCRYEIPFKGTKIVFANRF
jgi:hypothetical protein